MQKKKTKQNQKLKQQTLKKLHNLFFLFQSIIQEKAEFCSI